MVFHSSYSVDMVIFSLHLAGVSSLLASMNFIITASCYKTVGNSLGTYPLALWSLLVTVALLVLALPVLAGTITMLLLERQLSSSYFDTMVGGDPVLFQHMF